MSDEIKKPETVAEMLETEDPQEQARKIDALIRQASLPDIVVTLHYKPSTQQIYFGATAIALPYDKLIQLLSEGIKAVSLMKAKDAQQNTG